VKRYSWGFLVLVSLAVSLSLPLLYGGMASFGELAKLSPAVVVLLLGMVGGGWVFNAGRIRILARGLGVRLRAREALRTVISAEFAAVATPASTGGAATYIFLLSRRGLRLGEAAAIVAFDQLMDLIFFATVMPVALLLFLTGQGTAWAFSAPAILIGVLALGVILLLWLPRHYRPVAIWLGRVIRRVPGLCRLRYRLARWLIQFRRSVTLLLRLGASRLLLVYLLCIGHWMLRYGVLPVLLYFMGYSGHWSYIFLAQALMFLVGHLSFLPGGAGGVELVFGALLRPYLDGGTMAAAILVWRFCTFYWYLLAGAPVFIFTTGRRVLGFAADNANLSRRA
jgi:uncharacterized protein (TIRG00374 family)